jgi:hypothetical protein
LSGPLMFHFFSSSFFATQPTKDALFPTRKGHLKSNLPLKKSLLMLLPLTGSFFSIIPISCSSPTNPPSLSLNQEHAY